MSDYFVYCKECGNRVGRELTEDEAAEMYVAHQVTEGHDELFIKKGLDL